MIRDDNWKVAIAAMGAMVIEALVAAEPLTQTGVPADVLCVTGPGLLFRALHARRGLGSDETWILDQLFPADRDTPLITVLDGHPHTLAFLAGITALKFQQHDAGFVITP